MGAVVSFLEVPMGLVSRKHLKASSCLPELHGFQINNGESVKFWYDLWCCWVPLKDMYPLLFSLTLKKQGCVKDHVIRNRSLCLWNLHFRRNIND